MRKKLSGILHYLIPLLVLAACIILRWQDVPLVGQLRMNVFDTYQRIAPRDFQDAGVRIVDIDDKSLAELGQWPWPRTRLAELIYKLRVAGAAVVGFDIIFAEPDRTSPARVVGDWPQDDNSAEIRKLAGNLPDHDALFAQFIDGVGQIVTATQLTNGKLGNVPRQVGNFSIAGAQGRNIAEYIPTLSGAATNLPALEDAAAGNALINVTPGADGVVRRVPLLLALDAEQPLIGKPVYPTLSMEMLRVMQDAPRTMNVRLSGASGAASWTTSDGVDAIRVGQLTIPSDATGNMWVYFTGHEQQRYISASDVMNGNLPEGALQDTAVLIGTSAAGLLDLRSSPLNPVLPGVEVHAEMLEQMLLQQFLSRPYWASQAEMLALVIVGLFFIIAIPRLGPLWPAVIGVALIGGAIGFSWWAFRQHHMLIDPLYASLATILVYLTGSLIGFMRTEGEKRQVRGAFSTYLSPALVEQLAQHPERLKLGGEMRDMTLLFCDVRGFTTISESYKSDPQGLTQLINRLLTPLTSCILQRDGTIDKYMGDCIMAFWNAPLDVPLHPEKACESALAMFVALRALNDEREAEAKAEGKVFLPLNIGIGVNTGTCVVGNMGSDQRFDYSVLGDAVNLASRLEGQSKNYGVDIVIGQDTAVTVSERFAVLQLDLIAVKGKSEAVEIFTVLGDRNLRDSSGFAKLAQNHDAMITAYRGQNWDLVEELLAGLRENTICDLSVLYDMYDERISAFRKMPPGPDWDGVFVATSK
ncbi:CHASE2 domain-containing protein [Thalassospira marina]|uniref:Adenylate/guanylate cyclase domain-containing protein n=1 Tax=Thalassospira marina TaxID=2048283 RepID=A0A2N3KZ88_9PROT|nr:adenylate/guanylate cyclase domain-containing protein [Thalassospira marina]PKR55848.1 adenylate/guanylate cyclase domain-containing protein [Thalassospira marina]